MVFLKTTVDEHAHPRKETLQRKRLRGELTSYLEIARSSCSVFGSRAEIPVLAGGVITLVCDAVVTGVDGRRAPKLTGSELIARRCWQSTLRSAADSRLGGLDMAMLPVLGACRP